MQDLWGKGMLGLMGVDHRSKSRSSMVVLESCAVLSMVLQGSDLLLYEPVRPGKVRG